MQDNGRPVTNNAGTKHARFKAWGVAYVNSCDGIMPYTVAIVEYANGAVDWWHLSDMRFTDRQPVEAK